jgi:hypothetical protein
MGESGQRHAQAALYPSKVHTVPIAQETGWAPEPVWTQRLEKKSFASAGDRVPVVQSVARHYIDWATPAPIVSSGKWEVFSYSEDCTGRNDAVT